jgi:hypothetical protein
MINLTSSSISHFAIIVTDPENPEDAAFPLVISPPNGYNSKEEAIAYIENFTNRKIPYLGLHFNTVTINSENSFGLFCSWED